LRLATSCFFRTLCFRIPITNPIPYLHFLIPVGSNPTGERTRKELEDADPSAAPSLWKRRPRLHETRGSLNCSKALNHHMIMSEPSHQKMDITSKPWLPIVTKLKRIFVGKVCPRSATGRSKTVPPPHAALSHLRKKNPPKTLSKCFAFFTLYSYSNMPWG
jgi:hypothetical protein